MNNFKKVKGGGGARYIFVCSNNKNAKLEELVLFISTCRQIQICLLE